MNQRSMGELAAYTESLALRHRLARIDPSNAQWRHDAACILNSIGDVHRKVGKNQEAIAAYEEGVAIWRQLSKRDPRDHHRQTAASISLKKLGDVKLEAADSIGAIAAYEESVVFRRRLLKRDPDNLRWLSDIAECLEQIGDLKFEAGDDEGTLTAYQEMLSIDRWLGEIDDSNTEWRWNLSVSLDWVGEVSLMLGNLDAAGKAYGESLVIRRRLAELDRSNDLWQEGVALTLEKITDLERVVREGATTPAEVRSADKTSAGLEEQPSLSTSKVSKLKDAAIGSALAAYEESLAIARNLLQQSARLEMRAVVRELALSVSERIAAIRTTLRRYEREGSASIESLSAKGRFGVHKLAHATGTMGLAQKWSIFEWSHNSSSPDGTRIEN